MKPIAAILFLSIMLLSDKCSEDITNDWDPKWMPQKNVTDAHLRGLSVVDDNVVWASGSKGTVIRTVDAGANWKEIKVPTAQDFEFRDIEAFSASTAYVLVAGEIAKIYKTINGGKNWVEQYHNETKGVFFDGFAFWDKQNGIAFSDQINGKLFIIETKDGGENWTPIPTDNLPNALKGEAGFAASGSGIQIIDDNVWIGTGGGKRARIFHSSNRGKDWNVYDTPLTSNESSGIFSIDFWDAQNGFAIGGSYKDSTRIEGNSAYTTDGGKTWNTIKDNPPQGYRSCVTSYQNTAVLLAVGRSGCDYSLDGGKNWTHFSDDGYYACAASKNTVWATGKGGKMAMMKLPKSSLK